jgi:hypothetical protein
VLTFRIGERAVTVRGAVPSDAISAPLTEEGVKERLAKLGGTPLSLSTEDIELEMDEGLNLPPSAINALRREATERLLSQKRVRADIGYSPCTYRAKPRKLNTALFLQGKTLTKVTIAPSPASTLYSYRLPSIRRLKSGQTAYICPRS